MFLDLHQLVLNHFVVYTDHELHGLCAAAKIIGVVIVEYSTFRSVPESPGPVCSDKLLHRTQHLIARSLLIETNRLTDGVMCVASIRPTRALVRGQGSNHAIDAQYEEKDSEQEEEKDDEQEEEKNDAQDNSEDSEKKYKADVKAYKYNVDSIHQIAHEMKAYTHDQPGAGWRVETNEGKLSCECNIFFKNGMCCHLVFACSKLQKDTYGLPLPAQTFPKRGNTARDEMAMRGVNLIAKRRRSKKIQGRPRPPISAALNGPTPAMNHSFNTSQ
jgi:hypothetical protein